jgi:DNA-binding response OmpR family regulator
VYTKADEVLLLVYSSGMRILVVEDQEKLAQSLVSGFRQEGYGADFLLDGNVATHRIAINHLDYDMVVLDIELPGMSGIEVLRQMRVKGITLPVILLTARDTTNDTVLGLDAGADDYVVKPFSFEELLSRIRAVTRRPKLTRTPNLHAGSIEVHTSAREVYAEGKKIELTLKEYRLLEYFLERPNQVLSRQHLADHVWDSDLDPFSRTMDVHINNLRNKLLPSYGVTIETIRGIGYCLRV